MHRKNKGFGRTIYVLIFTAGLSMFLMGCENHMMDAENVIMSENQTASESESVNEYQTMSENESVSGTGSVSEADLENEISENSELMDSAMEEKAEGVVEDFADHFFYDHEGASVQQMSDTCFLQPILQNPGKNSVIVQWFTEEEGTVHKVQLLDDENEVTREIEASTMKMSRLRGGKKNGNKDDATIATPIYKHVAVVDGLPLYRGYESERVAYRIESDGKSSQIYTLSATPAEGTPLRILLTSDLQIKNMCAANYQKVYEVVGNVDAILCAGDLCDVADRVYDWFYCDNSFFRCLTGTANHEIGGKVYFGAPLLQYAPIYTAIGNHDVMGVYSNKTNLSAQFNNPKARTAGKDDPNQTYNTITYEEMFELPTSLSGGERYYATTIGDVGLISLEVARVWRQPIVGIMGKYSENPGESPDRYGGGDFIFESVEEGSEQIAFLREASSADAYKNAKYKVTMFHAEAHSVGDNQVPAFTNPVPSTVTDPVSGQLMRIYDYPQDKDYITSVIEPMLEDAGTDLLFEAHSHLWNRFVKSGMNILESSNVGNSYGAYTEENGKRRSSLPSAFQKNDPYYSIRDSWNYENYFSKGEPSGLTLENGAIDSNSTTVFSILDTQKGTVDSYYFDTNHPESEIVLFDSFPICVEAKNNS